MKSDRVELGQESPLYVFSRETGALSEICGAAAGRVVLSSGRENWRLVLSSQGGASRE